MERGLSMTFKQTKGDVTAEACVMPAPGGMFKGYVRVTTKRGNQIIGRTTGRGCGRPVATAEAAEALAEAEARRLLGI
jgi:hypothetical protein